MRVLKEIVICIFRFIEWNYFAIFLECLAMTSEQNAGTHTHTIPSSFSSGTVPLGASSLIMWLEIVLDIYTNIPGVYLSNVDFLSKKVPLIVGKWLWMFHPKYLPSLATHFAHLSVKAWIPDRNFFSGFQANQSSSHFPTSSYVLKCWAFRGDDIDQNKC